MQMKFNPEKLKKLNNPERLKSLNPELIWQNFDVKNPETIIDIGAGTGFFASIFAKKIKQGTLYACDTSDVMIEYLKENLPTTENCKIIPLKSEENKIPLEDNVADLVYMINVYHELEEPEKMLKEAYRLLRRGGKFAIIDWKYEEAQDGPPISRRISSETIISALDKNRYKNIRNIEILPYHSFIMAEKL